MSESDREFWDFNPITPLSTAEHIRKVQAQAQSDHEVVSVPTDCGPWGPGKPSPPDDNPLGYHDQRAAQGNTGVAMRFNAGKPRYDLVPADAFAKLVDVYTIGSVKYSDRNWEKGFPWMGCYASLMRHVQAWASGEDLDVGPNGEFGPYPDHPEIHMKWTGLPHMALATWNCMTLNAFYLREVGDDDRVKLT